MPATADPFAGRFARRLAIDIPRMLVSPAVQEIHFALGSVEINPTQFLTLSKRFDPNPHHDGLSGIRVVINKAYLITQDSEAEYDGVNDVFWVVGSGNAQNAAQTPTSDIITTVDMGGTLVLGTGPNPAGLLGQVNIAVDHSGGANHGNVYVLASTNPPGADPLDIHFLVSDAASYSTGQTLSVDGGPPVAGIDV